MSSSSSIFIIKAALAVTLILVNYGRVVQADSRPRGIFIQVSSANTYILPYLGSWLSNICKRNLELPSTQTMNDLVLQDVASPSGNGDNFTMEYAVLDVIAPFLPGGSRQCFGNVFVGTVDLTNHWSGIGSAYFDGIQDKAFRDKNINMSKKVALEFKKRYPNTTFHWYITFEANLNYLTNSGVLLGYNDYLTRLIQALNTVNKGAIMWSPAFWNSLAEIPTTEQSLLRNNLNALFTSVKANASPGITWMNLQDAVGRLGPCTSLTITVVDAANLYRFLRDSFSFKSMQLNTELFHYEKINGTCEITENDAQTQIEHETYYGQEGVRLGSAFEIRYWRERWRSYEYHSLYI